MQFTVPGYGDIDPIAILGESPDALRIRFNQNELDPEAIFEQSALVPCDFNGTEWEEIADPGWIVPVEANEIMTRIMTPVHTIKRLETGEAQNVWGYSLWFHDGANYHFLGYHQFEQPFVLAEAGDRFSRFFAFDFTNVPTE